MKHALVLTLLLLLLFRIESSCQITNSTYSDESNIYFRVVDTLVSIVLVKEKNAKIIIESDDYILNRLPDSFSDLKIEKKNAKKRIKKSDGKIWIFVDRLNLDNNRSSIYASITREIDNNRRYWEDGTFSYTIDFIYDAEKKSYEIIDIDKGIVLR